MESLMEDRLLTADMISDFPSSTRQSPPPRRQKKRSSKQSPDIVMGEADDDSGEREPKDERASSPPDESNDGTNPSAVMDEDDGDPFRSSLFGSRSPLGLHTTLRALSGMMSGISSRLRDILSNLRVKDDPSLQLIALQDLSDLLLVSNEDNLSGLTPDPYVKELVALMQPSETGEENPEIMLFACRCLANLMEALRGSVANVVYGGAVPVLCQKLLDIQFIDLAEQALSVSSYPTLRGWPSVPFLSSLSSPVPAPINHLSAPNANVTNGLLSDPGKDLG